MAGSGEARARRGAPRKAGSALLALLLVLAPAACAWAETWEEAAERLELEAKQEQMDAASRDLFFAIQAQDTSKAALSIALGADVNQCVAYSDASRRQCVSRMLDYALQVYEPDRARDGGQAGLSMLRLLLRKGAMLIEDDAERGRRNSMALQKVFPKDAALLLFLESGYAVTPDLLAVALQYRSPVEPARSSFPLQLLLQNSPWDERSTFRTSDFGGEVRDGIIRHVRGLASLERPTARQGAVGDITLLHLAAVTGNTEIASYLIRQGVDISARTTTGVTPLEEAYALWIYTWDDAVWERDFRFQDATFLDFIRLLALHGVSTDAILEDYRARPGVYGEIFARYCREAEIPDPENAGGTTTLGDFLGRRFSGGEWTLTSYDALDMKAQNMCVIVVTYSGVLLSDKSRVRIPLVFSDDMLYIAGDRLKDTLYPVYRNGRKLGPEETVKFWRSLGLSVSYDDDL